MYVDPSLFPFTATLEREWLTIRDEFAEVGREAMMAWPEKFLYNDDGWEVFGLWAFGSRLIHNCERCPETARLVRDIPGMTTAGFSLLQPGTHIVPHKGYSGAVLRCHLGLVVPPGCEMRVGEEIRTWEEGRCLVFDDTVEHEVWHRGERARAVLLLDFRKSAHPEAISALRSPSPAAT